MGTIFTVFFFFGGGGGTLFFFWYLGLFDPAGHERLSRPPARQRQGGEPEEVKEQKKRFGGGFVAGKCKEECHKDSSKKVQEAFVFLELIFQQSFRTWDSQG